MTKQLVRCPCGHQWEWLASSPAPADLRRVCPACSARHQPTVAFSLDEVTALASSSPVILGFEIQEEISRGGMGVVYKAVQAGLQRVVALKVIHPARLRQSEVMSRFQREVRAAALLS